MSAPVTTTSMTFDDEFNALNASASGTGGWMTQFPYGGEAARTEVANHEAEYYSDSSVGTNPFSVSGGTLTITAAAGTNPDGLPFNSGLLTTYNSFSQEYGYFEMRAELPAGDGLWPAFWLLPSNNTWPPEIDVMEMLGSNPSTIYVSTHSGSSSAEASNTQAVTVANTSTGFHTYGVDWEPNAITWYFDGKAIATAATPSDMHQPMYMLLNLAVGAAGSWPGATDGSTPLPAHMLVDYVHAYATAATIDASSTFTAGVAASSGTTNGTGTSSSTGTSSTVTSGTGTSSAGTSSAGTSSAGTSSAGTTGSGAGTGTASGAGTATSGTTTGSGGTVATTTSAAPTVAATAGTTPAAGGVAAATSSSGWVVTAAGGSSSVTLPDGGTAVTLGSDAVQLSGSGVVYAAGPAVTVQGGGGRLLFVGGAGTASVGGGAGSVLAYAGSGGGSLSGGTAGGNILVAAAGNTTLQGAGNGDVLFGPATASGAVLAAGAGAEVLVAGTGASTLVGGTGSATLFLGGGAAQQVVAGAAGSSEAVVGFRPGVDALSLGGASVAGSVTGAWGTTLVLSDGARVTMFGVG